MKTVSKEKPVKSNIVYNNFTYELDKTPKTLRLTEMFLGNKTTIGEVRSWKRPLLQELAFEFKEKDERELGYRLFLAIKVLNKVRQTRKSTAFLNVMKELTLEETVFWVWQYHSYRGRAINAFKCIHLNEK